MNVPSESSVIARIKRNGRLDLTPDELDWFERQGALSSEMRRILAANHYTRGNFERSIEHLEQVLSVDATPEDKRNYAGLLIRVSRHLEARQFVDKNSDEIGKVVALDLLCQICFALGDISEAVKFGEESLTAKDKMAGPSSSAPVLQNSFYRDNPDGNIIAFSLFGDSRRYLEGAVRNAIVARYLFPEWRTRFYVDGSVPAHVVHKLLAEAAQVRQAPNLPAARFGLYWRFLVEDDPTVNTYLIRDADSVVTYRERGAVDAWLKSRKPFHVMRDFPTHSELMLAGMWGAHRGNLSPMGSAILSHEKANTNRLLDRTADQVFLRQVVWPQVRENVLVHDTYFRWGGSVPFPAGLEMPWPRHVGQNDEANIQINTFN